MARGGKRTGTPGKAYTNRTDLSSTQPIQAPSGGAYGERKALEDAQRAMPLQNAQGAAQAAMGGGMPQVMPGELGAFDRPTDNPAEPVTAGIPAGAGPGPEALLVRQQQNTARTRLQAIYARFPSEGIRELLENMDNGF